ncbi:AAA family ATPase [Halegenticoccus tardaugens]|uniref:AAA family ATPase n=1 Tax=Halegenticoccus tardaugens TaxID=2071624 RepID=UPI00100C24FE|nr:AAA family ATPase [Halegenticoccus tardaugens]
MDLTVRPAAKGQLGDGLAAMSATVMDALGAVDGDFVRLAGPDGRIAVASARTVPSETLGETAVRIGRPFRRTLSVDVGNTVNVERIGVDPANHITISLPDLDVSEAVGASLRGELVGRGVVAGQTLAVPQEPTSGSKSSSYPADAVHRLLVHVVDTEPSGPVVISKRTYVSVASGENETVPGLTGRPMRMSVTYRDVGGLDAELAQIRELVELSIRRPWLLRSLGVESPTGILLHGPSGVGKTLLATAVATELDTHLQPLSAANLASGRRSEAADRLRVTFEEAMENPPSIIFIDDLDAVSGSHDDRRNAVTEVVTQLIASLDDLSGRDRCLVIGATDRVEALDPALRRPGRFDREIEIGVPNQADREEILRIHTRHVPLTDDVDLTTVAERTHGFVGADLESLIKESAMRALRRVDRTHKPEVDCPDPTVFGPLAVTRTDVEDALQYIKPSGLREVFVEVPDVSWDDVGGLSETKQRLQETVQWPLAYPDAYERVSLTPAKGILLYGPPGTGKTLLAKAVANESTSNFISIKGPELLNKYVGESEKGVREIFAKARENAPTVVFFDEIDAIAGERGQRLSDSGVGERVVSQLLTELDGLEDLEGVVVIATTNRPDLLDDALVRSGRFDHHIDVTVPDEPARREIFAVHTRDKPLTDVDVDDLASRTNGYVGADIEAVCREAAASAVRGYVRSDDMDADEIVLTREHFERALQEATPSATDGGREGHHEKPLVEWNSTGDSPSA